jgi:hypothetical protein
LLIRYKHIGPVEIAQLLVIRLCVGVDSFLMQNARVKAKVCDSLSERCVEGVAGRVLCPLISQSVGVKVVVAPTVPREPPELAADSKPLCPRAPNCGFHSSTSLDLRPEPRSHSPGRRAVDGGVATAV